MSSMTTPRLIKGAEYRLLPGAQGADGDRPFLDRHVGQLVTLIREEPDFDGDVKVVLPNGQGYAYVLPEYLELIEEDSVRQDPQVGDLVRVIDGDGAYNSLGVLAKVASIGDDGYTHLTDLNGGSLWFEGLYSSRLEVVHTAAELKGMDVEVVPNQTVVLKPKSTPEPAPRFTISLELTQREADLLYAVYYNAIGGWHSGPRGEYDVVMDRLAEAGAELDRGAVHVNGLIILS